MRSLLTAFAISALALVWSPTPTVAEDYKIDPDSFAAIAYSAKTGKYGYAWNQRTREAAEAAAMKEVKEPDAKPLTWVKFGWTVLVIAEDNAYGFDEVHGEGANSKDAYEGALKQLRKHTKAKVKTVVVVCSGDVKPKVTNY